MPRLPRLPPKRSGNRHGAGCPASSCDRSGCIPQPDFLRLFCDTPRQPDFPCLLLRQLLAPAAPRSGSSSLRQLLAPAACRSGSLSLRQPVVSVTPRSGCLSLRRPGPAPAVPVAPAFSPTAFMAVVAACFRVSDLCICRSGPLRCCRAKISATAVPVSSCLRRTGADSRGDLPRSFPVVSAMKKKNRSPTNRRPMISFPFPEADLTPPRTFAVPLAYSLSGVTLT